MRMLSLPIAAWTLVSCGSDALRQLPEQAKPPIAVIAPVQSSYPTPSTVRLDGRGSYDLDGAVAAFTWNVVSAPAGNANFPAPAGADAVEFVAGMAGSYVVALQVEDDDGNMSEPALVTFEATVAEAIHVELTWDYGGNDVDLHLLRGAAAVADPVNDCHYANCLSFGGASAGLLDWGLPGSSADDPSLDLDNIGDTVPENINLDHPEAGQFSIVVNYYDDAGLGAAHPRVRVFVDGALAAQFGPVTLSGSCSKWRVARISMPSGAVTAAGDIWSDLVDCDDRGL